MPTADANYTALEYILESTFGVTPSPARTTRMRFTGESLAHEKATVTSEEIRSDRQRSDLIKVGAMASGPIQFELNQADYQPFFLAALGAAAWTTVNVTATTAIDLATQTLTTTGAGFAGVPVGGFVKITGAAAPGNNGIKRVLAKDAGNNILTLAAGGVVATEASVSLTITAKDARNGVAQTFMSWQRTVNSSDGMPYYQTYVGMAVDELALEVASKAIVKGTLTFKGKIGAAPESSINNTAGAFAAGTLTCGATDPADGDVVVVGNRTYTLRDTLGTGADEVLNSATPATLAANLTAAINGTAAGYNVTHRAATPHTQVNAVQSTDDVIVTAKVMGAAANAYATTTTSSTGELDWGAATLTGGADATAPYPASSAPVLNGTGNVGFIYEGNTVATTRFKSIKLSVKNNLRDKDAIGEEGAFELGWGTIDVTGSLESYFGTNNLYRSLIAHDYTALAFVLTGADGKSLAFTFPYVNFGTGNPSASAINTDVMMTPDFTAIMHPELGCTVIINAFD